MCGWLSALDNKQMAELTQKISEYEEEVKQLIHQADESSPSNPPSEGHGAEHDDDSDASDTDDELEDRFVELEEDLAQIVADVHDLGQSRILCRERILGV